MSTTNKAAMTTTKPGILDEYRAELGAKLDVIRQTIAKGTSDAELALFLEVAKRSGLDPFARQIYAVVRDSKHGRSMAIQTGIDGYRAMAQRTGVYDGQRGPFWCGHDGEWRDVWLSSEAPAAAKVEVLRRDFREPIVGVALWQEYNAGTPMWDRFGTVMLAKCAEALALRRAFPQELSGIYTAEEMEQADQAPSMHTLRERTATSSAPRKSVADMRAAEGGSTSAQGDNVIDAEVIDAASGEVEEDRPSPLPSKQSLRESCAMLIDSIDAAVSADEVDEVLIAWLDGGGAGTRAESGARSYAACAQANIEGGDVDPSIAVAGQRFRAAIKNEDA